MAKSNEINITRNTQRDEVRAQKNRDREKNQEKKTKR